MLYGVVKCCVFISNYKMINNLQILKHPCNYFNKLKKKCFKESQYAIFYFNIDSTDILLLLTAVKMFMDYWKCSSSLGRNKNSKGPYL